MEVSDDEIVELAILVADVKKELKKLEEAISRLHIKKIEKKINKRFGISEVD